MQLQHNAELHARASEIAGAGMISSDLAGHIPAVWKELINPPEEADDAETAE